MMDDGIVNTSVCKGTMVCLLPLRLRHKLHRLHLLDSRHLMPVQYLQSLQLVEHPELVAGFQRSGIIKQIQMFHAGQSLHIPQQLIQIPEFVIVEHEGFYMFEQIENAIDGLDFVILQEEMLYSEVFLQSLQGSQAVVVQPENLEVGEVLEMDEDCCLAISQVDFGGRLGLFVVFDGDDVPRVGLDFVLYGLVFGEQVAEGLVHCSYKNDDNFIGLKIAGSGFGGRILLLGLPLLLFLNALLLLLSSLPLILSMFEGSEFDAFGYGHLVDSFEFQIGVDGIEKVKFEFDDEGVVCIRWEIREQTISLRLGRSFVLRISSNFSMRFQRMLRQFSCSQLGKVSSNATIYNDSNFTTFLRRCRILMLGISSPPKDLILFSPRQSSLSSGKLDNPCKLAILFLLSSSFLSLGCPPKVSIFSILFSIRLNSIRFGTLIGTSSATLLKFRLRILKVFHPYSTFRALKSLTLFFYILRETRLGRAATGLQLVYDE